MPPELFAKDVPCIAASIRMKSRVEANENMIRIARRPRLTLTGVLCFCADGRTGGAQWFVLKLNRRNAPWAFAREEAFRTIASLELLCILVAIMVLMPTQKIEARVLGSVSFTCGTGNQGNSYLLDKLMTTKYL